VQRACQGAGGLLRWRYILPRRRILFHFAVHDDTEL